MQTPVSSLRNLGPETEAALARASIHSAEELRALGSDAAYRRLLNHGERPHFIAYYVRVMALQGRPWNHCRGAEKLSFANVSTRSRRLRTRQRPMRSLKKRSTLSGWRRAGQNNRNRLFILEKYSLRPCRLRGG
jgi:hypothetical protein